MEKIIEINDLTFNYGKKKLFNNLNLDINKGTFITILGTNGSGKSTLAKILLGIIPTENFIMINGLNLNNNSIKKLRKDIGFSLENPNESIIMDTVIDDIIFSVNSSSISKKSIDMDINNVLKELGLDQFLYQNPKTLSDGQKQLVVFTSILIIKPKLVILDDSFSMLDNLVKDKMFKLLKKLNNEQGVTVINFTSDIEESLYGKEIAVLDKGSIIFKDKKIDFFKNKNIFKHLEIDKPFLVELSTKLNYYNLFDDIILDMDKMVNKLWK